MRWSDRWLAVMGLGAVVVGCSRTALDSDEYLPDEASGGRATGGTRASGGVGKAGRGGGKAVGGSPTGGRATGGFASGGKATGGKATGGRATGGFASGGKATGGRATGGYPNPSGGRPTGGFPSGGYPTGGVSTGGKGYGGFPIGGVSTGGIGYGGKATGGYPTGGVSTGGKGIGGYPTGGVSTGGKATGGYPTGGVSTGGKATGGYSSGGVSSGGKAVGGYPTGGVSSGGKATGGYPTGGSSSGGTGGCPPAFGTNEELIDDMNDGDQYILSVPPRVGIWTDSHDSTPGATMWPDPSGPFQMAPTGDPCHGYAVHVYGGQFVDDSVAEEFGFTLGGFYNASAYTAISFSLKNASSQAIPLHIVFPDKDTLPDYGICSMNSASPDICWNHFGVHHAYPSSPSAWGRYTIRFSDLSQDPGWGYQAPAFDPATLHEVRFIIPSGSAFDLWVDDVTFVR